MSTSTLLAGSKTGPCGVYQGTEPLQGAIHDIETILLIVILTFGFGVVLSAYCCAIVSRVGNNRRTAR
jgi:hypothetical protein